MPATIRQHRARVGQTGQTDTGTPADAAGSRRSTVLEGHVGDTIEARGIHGQPARHGSIVEVIGEAVRRRYRVRWDDERESIVYPDDGVMIAPRAASARR